MLCEARLRLVGHKGLCLNSSTVHICLHTADSLRNAVTVRLPNGTHITNSSSIKAVDSLGEDGEHGDGQKGNKEGSSM